MATRGLAAGRLTSYCPPNYIAPACDAICRTPVLQPWTPPDATGQFHMVSVFFAVSTENSGGARALLIVVLLVCNSGRTGRRWRCRALAVMGDPYHISHAELR